MQTRKIFLVLTLALAMICAGYTAAYLTDDPRAPSAAEKKGKKAEKEKQEAKEKKEEPKVKNPYTDGPLTKEEWQRFMRQENEKQKRQQKEALEKATKQAQQQSKAKKGAEAKPPKFDPKNLNLTVEWIKDLARQLETAENSRNEPKYQQVRNTVGQELQKVTSQDVEWLAAVWGVGSGFVYLSSGPYVFYDREGLMTFEYAKIDAGSLRIGKDITEQKALGLSKGDGLNIKATIKRAAINPYNKTIEITLDKVRLAK